MIQEWGYTKLNGPATWSNYYPAAAGQRQSPVDINTSDAIQDSSLSKLEWKYVPENANNAHNTGCGWKVTINGHNSELKGGPLKDVYTIEQFHCHWGSSNTEGSEHTVDGKSYPAELHLVHANLTKYKTMAEALKHSDGLCVLGIFIKIGREHPEMNKIISNLSAIKYKHMSTRIGSCIDLAKFIPASKAYWTYPGSLTTPPCSECVIWIVFQDAIEISQEQLNSLRSSMSCCDKARCKCKNNQCMIKNNFRPTLPLGKRAIKTCITGNLRISNKISM